MIFIEAHSGINLTKGSVFQQAPDDTIDTTLKEKAKSEAKGLKKPDHLPPRYWQFHHHLHIPHQPVRN